MRYILLTLLALAFATTLPAQAAPDRRVVTWSSSVSLREAQLTTVGVIDVERHDTIQPNGQVYSGTVSFTVVSSCWRVRLGTDTYGLGWGQGYCLYFPLAGGS